MNIEEIDNKIKKLQEEIENLKEKKDKQKRWKANKNEIYYYVTSHDYAAPYETTSFIERDSENNATCDNFRYETGNYFKTENEAIEYKDKLIIYQKLKDLALELNQGEQIDFDNEKQKKYIIILDDMRNLNIISSVYQQSIGQIYCLDENFLEKAKERIGEDKLKKLFE